MSCGESSGLTAGQTTSVSAIVQLGADGYISVTNSSSGTADVSVTVFGYTQDDDSATAGDTYVGLPYTGVLDTRSGYGEPQGQGQIPAGGSVTVQVTGLAGVPADAAGAVVYLGAANASQAGWISAYPAGSTDPALRALSYTPGQTVRSLYFGTLPASGQLTLTNHGSAPVDLMAAVQGYLVSPTASEAGSSYDPVSPQRIADTRFGTGGVPATPVPADGSITFTATGIDGIPSSGVSAVAASVAASNPTATGFLSVYPAGGTDPANGAVNFTGGDSQDNDLTAPLVSAVSPTGQVTVTNHSSGTVDVIVSGLGYYTAPVSPDAPMEADAGIQNGTATITWAPPPTDGGAAITSYTATVYNSDGSVNQAISAGPTATSATAGGLSDSSTYTIGVSATNAVGTSSQGTAPVSARSTVPQPHRQTI